MAKALDNGAIQDDGLGVPAGAHDGQRLSLAAPRDLAALHLQALGCQAPKHHVAQAQHRDPRQGEQ